MSDNIQLDFADGKDYEVLRYLDGDGDEIDPVHDDLSEIRYILVMGVDGDLGLCKATPVSVGGLN